MVHINGDAVVIVFSVISKCILSARNNGRSFAQFGCWQSTWRL